jgi:hypothetical protein
MGKQKGLLLRTKLLVIEDLEKNLARSEVPHHQKHQTLLPGELGKRCGAVH